MTHSRRWILGFLGLVLALQGAVLADVTRGRHPGGKEGGDEQASGKTAPEYRDARHVWSHDGAPGLSPLSPLGSPLQFDNNTPVFLPDLSTTNIPIAVSGFGGAIGKVTVSFHITHTYVADLDIFLIAPDGTIVELTTDNGGGGSGYGIACSPQASRTTLDDDATLSIVGQPAPMVGTFRPEGSLASFNGKSGADVNGTWILRITDDAAFDVGTFHCTSLFLTPRTGFDVISTSVLEGNGNGFVDANECNRLVITLRNIDSSPLTGIVGTLSTTTPEVTVVQGTSDYPDMAPSATASNVSPFVVSTSPGFVCGTAVEFTLTLTHSAGSDIKTISLAAASARFDNNTVTPIPDLGSISLPFTVSGMTDPITRVTVSVHLTHTFNSDLVLALIGPDNTTVILSNRRGGSGDNFGISCAARTVFDDEAPLSIAGGSSPFLGTFRPEQPLSAFHGKTGADANGTWILRISDHAAFDVGTFQCASLVLEPRCEDGGGTCCPVVNPPLSVGYWKNHPEAWPVNSLTLGTTHSYTQDELLNILRARTGGNGADASLILARQLIAAKLNLENCASGCETTIQEADNLIGARAVPIRPLITPNTPQGQQMVTLAATLDACNTGLPYTRETGSHTDIPEEFALEQNYPNPFNPVTRIAYGLPVESRVTLEVFDILGQRVALLAEGWQPAGFHEVEFRADHLSSGLYFYRLHAEGTAGSAFTRILKLMLVR